ncbi:MAG: S8 family serine peptidase [Candidatus Omnitrophica bacterium]|nr:S8 family serine peptidase [Candidatus Omnitrophota bacterium]
MAVFPSRFRAFIKPHSFASIIVTLSVVVLSVAVCGVCGQEEGDPGKAYVWEFDEDGNAEGWSARNLDGAAVSAGSYVGTAVAANPNFLSRKQLRLVAEEYCELVVRCEVTSPQTAAKGKLRWITSEETQWDAAKQIKFDVVTGALQDIRINLSDHAEWHGVIEQIRYFPVLKAQEGRERVSIDRIEFLSAEIPANQEMPGGIEAMGESAAGGTFGDGLVQDGDSSTWPWRGDYGNSVHQWRESGNDGAETGAGRYAPHRILIKLRGDFPSALEYQASQPVPLCNLAPGSRLAELYQKFGVEKTEPLFRPSMKDVSASMAPQYAEEYLTRQVMLKFPKRAERVPEGVAALSTYHVYCLELREDVKVMEAVKAFASDPLVEYAQPDYQVELEWLPKDEYFYTSNSWGQDYPDLWGLKANQMNMEDAWDITLGKGTVVAVVDTGLDYTHPDIAESLWINEDEVPANGIDDDGNGFVDDIRGWDFAGRTYDAPPDNDVMDFNGHGTHVSGTIAAQANDEGVIGVAPEAKIMPLKGFCDNGSGYISMLAEAMAYAADNGADVMNCSWSGPSYNIHDFVAESAVNYAMTRGCVVVFAAANDYGADAGFISPQNMSYPDAKPIVVSASTPFDTPAVFTNGGYVVDVCAPGGGEPDLPGVHTSVYNILSLKARYFNHYYAEWVVNENLIRLAGTSMAAPHVSGLAALVLAKNPDLNVDQVRQTIRAGARDIFQEGQDFLTGVGCVNAPATLDCPLPPECCIHSPFADGSVTPVGELRITGTASGPGFEVYLLRVASLDSATHDWTYLAESVLPVQNGLLGVWNVGGLPIGSYGLELTVKGAKDKSYTEFKRVIVEPSFEVIPFPAAMYSVFGNSMAVVHGAPVGHYSGYNGFEISLVDLSTKQKQVLQRTTNYINGLAYAGNALFYLEESRGLVKRDMEDGREELLMRCHSLARDLVYSDGRLAFVDVENSQNPGEVFVYYVTLLDLATGAMTRLQPNPTMEYARLAISDKYLVWNAFDFDARRHRLWLYSLETQQGRWLLENEEHQAYAAMDGDKIAFKGYVKNVNEGSSHAHQFLAGESRICLLDIESGNIEDLTDEKSETHPPAIGDGWVVWEVVCSGMNSDLYGFNMKSGKTERLTAYPLPQFWANINGGRLFYSDIRAGLFCDTGYYVHYQILSGMDLSIGTLALLDPRTNESLEAGDIWEGDAARAEATVTWIGENDSGPFQCRWDWNDEGDTPGPAFSRVVNVDNMAPGDEQTFEFLRDCLGAGEHTVSFEVDIAQVVSDPDQTNNKRERRFVVRKKLSDLVPEKIEFYAQESGLQVLPMPGQPLFLRVPVLNKGAGNSGEFKMEWALTGQSSSWAKITAYPNLASGEISTGEQAQVSWIPQAGVYKLSVQADSQRTVEESDETNNERLLFLDISDTPLVDLAVEGLQYLAPPGVSPGGPKPGERESFLVTVRNAGAQLVKSVSLSWFFDDRLVGVAEAQLLFPGGVTQLVVEVRMPLEGGLHQLKAHLDPENRVIEGYESNNVAVLNMDLPVPNQRPHAVALLTPLRGDAPLSVRFDASQSTDPEGEKLRYWWSFGDEADSPYSESISGLHTFMEEGFHAVTLMVTDPGGLSSKQTQTIKVSPPAAPFLWRFDQDGDMEGWSTYRMLDVRVQEGSLQGASRHTWAHTYSLSNLGLPAAEYGNLFLRYEVGSTRSKATLKLRWITESDTVWNDAKQVYFEYTPGTWQDVRIDLSNHAEWKGTIRQFRIYPIIQVEPGEQISFSIDKIQFMRTGEEDLVEEGVFVAGPLQGTGKILQFEVGDTHTWGADFLNKTAHYQRVAVSLFVKDGGAALIDYRIHTSNWVSVGPWKTVRAEIQHTFLGKAGYSDVILIAQVQHFSSPGGCDIIAESLPMQIEVTDPYGAGTVTAEGFEGGWNWNLKVGESARWAAKFKNTTSGVKYVAASLFYPNGQAVVMDSKMHTSYWVEIRPQQTVTAEFRHTFASPGVYENVILKAQIQDSSVDSGWRTIGETAPFRIEVE